ncbi:L,D-transpeptidase family protein [Microbaculum sp. FT89]|uniref:L,D-transpeptidase family protein n=1 Tax=Microbaculum sp. FT89 TaxID=3447298 RepID=UPI003F53656C
MITLRQSRIALVTLSLLAVGGCMDEQMGGAKHLQPLSYATLQELEDKGMRKEDPIVVRIFKEESTLEVWKPGKDGRFALFKTYEICKWSGELGPKIKEGDRQAPEGFYTVAPGQMNPNSSYYLSFNIGFPNAYDQALGRTGKYLMVHGACSSAGCYAMTDETIAEVYALARDSFRGGQREFQVQAYPFRMTPANMARHAGNPNMSFWKSLKEGSDHFEVAGVPPKVGVCGRDYVFNAKPANPNQKLIANARCPQLDVPDEIEVAVAAKKMRDETAFQVALAEIKMQEQQQQQSRSNVIMTASIEEQGDAANASDAQADKVLGKQVAESETSAETKPAESDFALTGNPATVGADAGDGSSVATAFSGVWGKLVGITGGLRTLGNVKGNEAATEPDADADPITTGTVPTPAKTPDDKSASIDSGLEDGLPRLTPATAFVPILVNENPFVVFDYFEEVDGVSVPADLALHERAKAPLR